MSEASTSRHVKDLEQALGLLDALLVQSAASPPVLVEDNCSSALKMDRNLLNFGLMDDDSSLRPKSFLHDEMDEFNQIFSELARSKQSKSRYLSGDFKDLFCDGNETPVAPLSPALTETSQFSSSGVCLSADDKTELLLSSDIDDRLYISEDINNVATGARYGVHSAVADAPVLMRRSLSCAETSGIDKFCGTRPYDSLTSHLRRYQRNAERLESEFRANRSPGFKNLSSVLCTSSQPCRPVEDRLDEDDADADSGYQSGNNTMVSSAGRSRDPSTALSANDLQRRINCFNANSHGLTMSAKPNTDVFQGFIRVHMNLHKPINMALTTGPSSVYDVALAGGSLASCEEDVSTENVSFYLPNNTVKVIHITSEMTTPLVIQTLLNKFMITDSSSKFALYEKLNANGAKVVERPLNEMMRRLGDDERPLELCLRWSDEGVDSLDRHQFILQDNVTGEIAWDAFSLPELEAFLRILEREEDSYVSQIRLKYSARKLAAEKQLRDLEGRAVDGRKLT
jgi:Ras association domain-containing protein 1